MKKGQSPLKTMLPPDVFKDVKERKLGYGDSLREYDALLAHEQERLNNDETYESERETSSSLFSRTEHHNHMSKAAQRLGRWIEIQNIRIELDKALMPYTIAKKQSTQLSGDADNPLTTEISITVVEALDGNKA